MRGALAVALGLIALQWLTSSTVPGLSGALAYPAQLVQKWMDPTVALISQGAPAAGSTSAAPSVADQVGQGVAGIVGGPLGLIASSATG